MPKLGFLTKTVYGVGQAAEGIKNFSFETFLFFYFSRVLGLSGSAAGAAVAIALVFDAVTDPLAGSLSDSFRHKWGRRHPFMYAAAPPLALSYGLLFSPPAGLGSVGLFVWLTIFTILVRTSMTLYHVPHLSLGAELSNDYQERTSIVGFRVIFSALGSLAVAVLARTVFFTPTADLENGQLDAAAYPSFGWFFAGLMLVTILMSAAGTHSRIATLPKAPDDPEPPSLGRVGRELREAFRNDSFRFFVTGIFIFFVARGVQLTLNLDMLTYFWNMKEKTMGVLVAMVFAFTLGIPFWAAASRWLDKKPTILTGISSFSILILLPPLMKLLGLWPAPDSPLYAPGIIGMTALAAFGGAAGIVAAGSMMADIADEHELSTHRRQEGIFFGALSFSVKSSSGAGHLIAGLAMDAIAFPRQVTVAEVAPETIRSLGWIFCGFLLVLGTFSVTLVSRYRLTRKRHAEISAELGRRRA